MISQPLFWLTAFGAIFAAPEVQRTRAELDATFDSQNAEIERHLAELKKLDADLLEMRQHVPELEGNPAFRLQQIKSLRLRHPTIVVADDADAQGVYSALFRVRQQVRLVLQPLVAATRYYTHREHCTSTRSGQQARELMESSPGFLRLPLSKRSEWKVAYDRLMDAGSDTAPCRPEDYLPTEPVTDASLARSLQRYEQSEARARRIADLTRRP